MKKSAAKPASYVLERRDFQALIDALAGQGYEVVGPTLGEGAVVYDTLTRVEEMPIGKIDVQSGGSYRLTPCQDEALFGYTVSPQSWKRFLYPPEARLWQAQRRDGTLEIVPEKIDAPKIAFLGVRACELHAIQIQDRIFMGGDFVDANYRARRENIFIVAVNCGQAGGTCFCVSMNTGPKVKACFDLALTEIIQSERHYFVLEVGSKKGEKLLKRIPHQPASAEDIAAAERVVQETADHMGRELDTTGLKELLYHSYEHPRWEVVAARCLTCANCTMVCPTCFCATIEDVTDLTGEHAARIRKWDSCFTMDFSYIHGGSVRSSTKARYRQWMTHKLATWIDQFGMSGCVGCGRCITWCPVGIDITEEAAAIRSGDRGGGHDNA